MNDTFRDEFHAEIPPVPTGVERPLWSVLIPTYNCVIFLKEALQSVIDQDPGREKMEIIVVDDCSSKDDPEQVVHDLGKNRVQFVRQKTNVGKVRNYETGLNMSRGFLIHQLHGDDKVRMGFYEKMEKLFEDYPRAGAAFCRSIYIDENAKWLKITGIEQYEDGIIPDFAERIAIAQRVQTPAMVVKREVYETLGGFDRRLNCMEDWEMWIRIANKFPVIFANELLAEYRTHNRNATYETLMNGSAITTHRLLLEIVDSYLDQDMLRRIKSQRNFEQAKLFLMFAQSMKHHRRSSALRMTLKALSLSLNPKIVYRALKSLCVGERR